MAFSLSHLSTQTHAIYHIYASHNSLHIWHLYLSHLSTQTHAYIAHIGITNSLYIWHLYLFTFINTNTCHLYAIYHRTHISQTRAIYHRAHIAQTTDTYHIPQKHIFHRPQTHAIMPYTTAHIFHRPAHYIFHFICKQGITPININTSHHMPFPTDI